MPIASRHQHHRNIKLFCFLCDFHYYYCYYIHAVSFSILALISTFCCETGRRLPVRPRTCGDLHRCHDLLLPLHIIHRYKHECEAMHVDTNDDDNITNSIINTERSRGVVLPKIRPDLTLLWSRSNQIGQVYTCFLGLSQSSSSSIRRSI